VVAVRTILRVQDATAPDQAILEWVLDHRSSALTSFFEPLTALGGTALLLPVTAVVVVLLVAVRRPWLGLFVALAGLGGLLLQDWLKTLFGRARPPAVDHLVHAASSAFPSGHALQSSVAAWSFAVVVTVLTTSRAARLAAWIGATVLVVLIGCSRVYLGVHWATDVLGGWIIGAAWVGLLVLLLRGRFADEPAPVEG
jgi:undecaprenyl-diphosphatase